MVPGEVPLVRTPTLVPLQGVAHQPYSPHLGGRGLASYPEPPRYAEPMGRHQSARPHYAPHPQYYYPPMSPGQQQQQQQQQPRPPVGSQGYPAPAHHGSIPPYHPHPHHHYHHQPPPPPM
ncbi:hypothetical protein H4R19_004025 [Coemansia spiralis]|nr:hypothetical protein H4R19_004025 [Coemansia spiralis]